MEVVTIGDGSQLARERRRNREHRVLSEDQLFARAKYERMIRLRMRKMGLGYKHQVQKKIDRIRAQMAKWKVSDLEYGQKLAIAMLENSTKRLTGTEREPSNG